MKKFYVLLSVMVLALMTAGFSYAYWTDTLTVNGTANTGTFGVELALETPQDALPLHVTENVTIDGETLSVTLNNLYPGASYTYRGYVDNVGSIPAQLVGITPSNVSADPQVLFNFVLSNDSELAVDGETWAFTLTITVPTTVTDFQDDQATASYTLDFTQFNA